MQHHKNKNQKHFNLFGLTKPEQTKKIQISPQETFRDTNQKKQNSFKTNERKLTFKQRTNKPTTNQKTIKNVTKHHSKKKKSSRFMKQTNIEPFFLFPREEGIGNQIFGFETKKSSFNKKYEVKPFEEKVEDEIYESLQIDRRKTCLTNQKDEENFIFPALEKTHRNKWHLSDQENSEKVLPRVLCDCKKPESGKQEQEEKHDLFQKGKQVNNFQNKRSVPIPINLKPNPMIVKKKDHQKQNYLRSNFAVTFIQPHKYVESLQTEIERELSKSFNVPLKRVPSWRI
ncbi:hypothetical protein M0812_20875 [Anaeramoeba flamelloides]|uniref:Uncharacterized protein n=1 Tax=Anaeramoeba flamelloides TaxID=1746091 RepID=A0AAV7YVK0_9EUKA|nr:hypothetical protein M0812_20875 [Anaeramoeba flamelloides]